MRVKQWVSRSVSRWVSGTVGQWEKRHSLLTDLLTYCLTVLLVLALPLAVLAQGEIPEAPTAWSANVPLFGDLGVSVQGQPALAMAGATVMVSWTDERNTMPDIFTSVYSNGVVAQGNTRITGATASNDTLDGPSDPKNDSASSAIVESSGRAFVAYSTQDDIVLARRESSGVGAGTWVSRTEMSFGSDVWYADARSPSLVGNVGNADNLVVVWQDFRNRDWDVYSTRCNGTTMKCQANVKVSNDASNEWQLRPRLAAKGNNVIAVWEDHRDGGASTPHIYASFSADGGASWGANVRVDAGADSGTNPAVAYEPNGQPWVVWEKHSGEPTAPADIYAAKWDGAAWGTATRIDKAPNGKRAGKPAVAINANGIVFFVWEDARNGVTNSDIFAASELPLSPMLKPMWMAKTLNCVCKALCHLNKPRQQSFKVFKFLCVMISPWHLSPSVYKLAEKRLCD